MISLIWGIYSNQIHREDRMVVTRGCGGGGQWGIIVVYRVSIWEDENILEMHCGDGCTTLNVLNATKLYT